jgi:hypothetical protein
VSKLTVLVRPLEDHWGLAAVVVALASLAACWSRAQGGRAAARPTPTTEVGDLDGAPYRIDIPSSWNGELVMYCHGYRGAPVRFDAHALDEMVEAFGPLGYAVAQSGYSAGGYAVREAGHDTEALRLYFVRRFGPPKETWLSGESLGGSVTEPASTAGS